MKLVLLNQYSNIQCESYVFIGMYESDNERLCIAKGVSLRSLHVCKKHSAFMLVQSEAERRAPTNEETKRCYIQGSKPNICIIPSLVEFNNEFDYLCTRENKKDHSTQWKRKHANYVNICLENYIKIT